MRVATIVVLLAACGPEPARTTGERCMHATIDGSPLPEVQCSGTPDACTCTRTDSEILGVCVPAQIMPEQLLAHCDTITAPDLCARFDVAAQHYCRWTPIQLLCEGRCEIAAQRGACVGLMYVGDGCGGSCALGDARGYTRAGPARLLLNPTCGDEPYAWQQCGAEGEGPACCLCPDG